MSFFIFYEFICFGNSMEPWRLLIGKSCLYFCLYISVFGFLSLAFCLWLSVFVSVFVFPSLSFSFCLCLSVFVFPSLSLCFYLSLSVLLFPSFLGLSLSSSHFSLDVFSFRRNEIECADCGWKFPSVAYLERHKPKCTATRLVNCTVKAIMKVSMKATTKTTKLLFITKTTLLFF